MNNLPIPSQLVPVFLIALALVVMTSCSMSQNYNNPSGPVYEGDFSDGPPTQDGEFKVITWNLRLGDQVDEAIETLSSVDELREADVILMQEMDEAGVERIAEGLSYNYVFYPTIFRTRNEKLQGNAILSKWSFVDHSKIILPAYLPGIMQTRIAVKGTLEVDGRRIDVYSVHLESIWLLPVSGNRQAEYLVSQIDPDRSSLVGGDYNSWNDRAIMYLEEQYQKIGLSRDSKGTGHTFESAGIRLTLDHLFSNVGEHSAAGVWRGSSASDHYPVWVNYRLNE